MAGLKKMYVRTKDRVGKCTAAAHQQRALML